MILVDSDVIIWNWRGNDKAAALLATTHELSVSAVTYMELVQGMRNQREWKNLQADLKLWQASVLPITEIISARAVKLVEAHFRSHHLQLADALIAATALEHRLPLLTGNVKHFKAVKGLKIKPFTVN